ncbi:A/G-specific adenine glycosylase, partial [bacterium]|nr:A/G-specific adenine glycosylase [bacterium]
MKLEKEFKSAFTKKLIAWYHKNKRDLPWRKTSDPYAVWISEVMLQQTQVDQVIPYYNKFMEQFPTLKALSEASLSDILKAWEGLGYYTRARNLKDAADGLKRDFHGEMPKTHDILIRVPGIGPYTAAAIASIALNEDFPVVDGNVLRVLSRVMKVTEPPNKKGIKS